MKRAYSNITVEKPKQEMKLLSRILPSESSNLSQKKKRSNYQLFSRWQAIFNATLLFFCVFSRPVEKMCPEFLWTRYNLRRVDRKRFTVFLGLLWHESCRTYVRTPGIRSISVSEETKRCVTEINKTCYDRMWLKTIRYLCWEWYIRINYISVLVNRWTPLYEQMKLNRSLNEIALNEVLSKCK